MILNLSFPFLDIPAGFIYTPNGMRTTLLTMTALALLAAPAPAETISTQVDITVQAPNQNFHAARQEAVKRAFATAVYRTAVGILPPASAGGPEENVIQERLVDHAQDFVASYKFLSENVDTAKGSMALSIEVTVFADMMWGRLRESGAVAGRRKGKKLIVLVNERSLSFMSKGDSLLLASLPEEVLVQIFRQNGLIVAARKEVRAAGLAEPAVKAMDGDPASIEQLGPALEADLVLLGKTEMKTSKTPQGADKISAVITCLIYKGKGGGILPEKKGMGEVESADMATGSADAIRAAAAALAKEILAMPETAPQ